VSLTIPSVPRTSPVIVVPLKEVEDRLAWRIPRLEFSGTPLTEVVAMINRHNTQQLVIADPLLESLALSGIVRADKVDALLALLQSEFGVKCERGADTIILRSAR
jgi:transmembrane sensor